MSISATGNALRWGSVLVIVISFSPGDDSRTKGFAGSADDNHERRKRSAGAGTNELDTALDKSQFDVWFGLVVVLVP